MASPFSRSSRRRRAGGCCSTSAYSADALLDPLWRHFHDEPRPPGPAYLDALAVLRELAELLSAWLMGRRGAWRSPLRAVPAAILEWTPRAAAPRRDRP